MTIFKLFFVFYIYVHFKTIVTYLKIIISIKSSDMLKKIFLPLKCIKREFTVILEITE